MPRKVKKRLQKRVANGATFDEFMFEFMHKKRNILFKRFGKQSPMSAGKFIVANYMSPDLTKIEGNAFDDVLLPLNNGR